MTDIELKTVFQQVEDELNKAYERNDVRKVAALLSDRWIILESSTGLSDKEQFIRAMEDGRLVQTKMVKEVQEVKLFDNFAIVISKGRNEGRHLGIPYNSEQWVTNVYVKEETNWICVMTQEVPADCNNQ